jgi:hypothetical protein
LKSLRPTKVFLQKCIRLTLQLQQKTTDIFRKKINFLKEK